MGSSHWQVKALFKPVRYPIGPLGRGLEGVVRDESVGKGRGLSPDRREVHVDHKIKHALLSYLGIVDLNLIRLCEDRCCAGQQGKD